jgi:hypothetical protein
MEHLQLCLTEMIIIFISLKTTYKLLAMLTLLLRKLPNLKLKHMNCNKRQILPRKPGLYLIAGYDMKDK